MSSHTETLLANNKKYAAGEAVHAAVHPGQQPIAPATHVAVVACMDARIDVEDLLGLKTGDAHVIRNAGGVVNEVRFAMLYQTFSTSFLIHFLAFLTGRGHPRDPPP